MITQLILIAGSVRDSVDSTRLESWALRSGAPVVDAGKFVASGIGEVGGRARDILSARDRNVEMEDRWLQATEDLGRYREAWTENERLRRLLVMRESLAPNSIAASVVSASIGPHSRSIIIDRGTADGVAPDMAVIAWGGVVGRVVATVTNHAKVWLSTDTNSSIAGIVQRTRAQGLVYGTQTGALEMRYVPTYEDVALGDRVVTSGLDGVFPKGFGLGTVIGIEASGDGIQTVQIRPEIDPSLVEEALVVVDRIPDIESP